MRQCIQLAMTLTDAITHTYFHPVDPATHSVGA